MKNIYKKLYATAALTLMIFALSGCGDGAHMRGENSINMCGDGADLGQSMAVKVVKKSKIMKLVDDTALRVWHYPNRDKLVCVIRGAAEFTAGGIR